jgi:hypothetical protein
MVKDGFDVEVLAVLEAETKKALFRTFAVEKRRF